MFFVYLVSTFLSHVELDFFLFSTTSSSYFKEMNTLVVDWFVGHGYGTWTSSIEGSTCREDQTLSSTSEGGMPV